FTFFFSSRRRHTRSKRDWSSDVCSSDLPPRQVHHDRPSSVPVLTIEIFIPMLIVRDDDRQPASSVLLLGERQLGVVTARRPHFQIGRASCRERVERPEGDGWC